MAKMMMKLDHFSKLVANGGRKEVNVMGATSDVSFVCVPIDSSYGVEVHYIGNQV